MPPQSLITRWNIAALIVIAGGSAATITLDQLWLRAWAASGKHVPVGPWGSVDLPAGESLVYYESSAAVPLSHVVLHVRDSHGRRMALRPPEDDNNYSLRFGGWSGRAFWSLTLDQAGTYTVVCQNATYLKDDQVPPNDRVAFFKRPNTLHEAMTIRSTIQIVGASLTVLLGAALYMMHVRALRKPPRR